LSNICENVRWSLKFISDKGFIFGDVFCRLLEKRIVGHDLFYPPQLV